MSDLDIVIAVESALAKIPERQRIAIRMQMDGYILEEIGTRLGFTKEAARLTINKGKRNLRKYFNLIDIFE